MGGPPAVTVVVSGLGLDGPIAVGMTFLLVLSLAGLFASGALQIPADLIYPLLLLLGSLGLAVFWVPRARNATHGLVLRWDGQNWLWSRQKDDGVFSVQCVMDLQVWMLLRLQTSEGDSEWIWLRRKDHRNTWEPLRRALIFDAVSVDDRPVAVDRE
jgi:hypothetical protein